jgi:hypothetical protein
VKRKNVIKILIGLGSFVLLIKLVTIVIVEPRIREKILTAINENNNGYVVALGRVHILLFSSGIDLKNITISSRKEPGFRSLYGEIASIKLKGIKSG